MLFSNSASTRPLTLSAVFFIIAAILYFLIGPRREVDRMGSSVAPVFKFEAVRGFFKQSEPGTDPNDFDNLKENFGIIERLYNTDKPGDIKVLTQWQRFDRYVRNLVQIAPPDTTYKVIYVGRHGEGSHNVAEAKYGTKAWDDYWSKLDGDGELYWFDAHLTEIGERQARDNNFFFRQQFDKPRMPAPEKYYVSPLYRCLQTANLSFSGLELPKDRLFLPMIKELLREVLGEHTCDKRSTRSVIHKAFPEWHIERGFSEEDELWQADHRETLPEHARRTEELLTDIFENDPSVFLSFTIHSGSTAALLHVLGHREYRIPTGGLVPILVKATKIQS